MPSRGAGLLQLVVLLALVSGAPVVAAKGFEGPDPAGLTQDKAPDVPQGAAAAEVGPRGLQGSPDAAGRGGAERADAPEGSAQTLTAPPVGVFLEPEGVLDPWDAKASAAAPEEVPPSWTAEPGLPPSPHPAVSLTDLALPPPTPGLDALQAQLDALPLDIRPSAATEFGFLLTDLAATGLFVAGLSALTASNENELFLYVVLTAASAVALPIGAITWAVGGVIDGHRRRALTRRRHQLMQAIDRELALHPHG